jgi:hypothetical protein
VCVPTATAAFLWYTGSNSRVYSLLLFSQVGQTCENQLDYFTALRKNGLGSYVPPAYKQRRSIPRSNLREMNPRYQQSHVKDWQRYQQTVWPEYRGHSFIEAQKPSSPMQLKAMHQHALSVFDRTVAQLQAFERAGRW